MNEHTDYNETILFRSIPLDEIWKWQHLEQTIHSTMNFFNYKEVRPPLVIPTDIISKVYNNDNLSILPTSFFRIDSEDSLYLRPDGTVSYLHHTISGIDFNGSNRFYYIGPMFRRSKADKFHNGQFHQFGAEAIGIDSYVIDIETIRLGLNILKKFGLSKVRLEISSYGCPSCRPQYQKKLRENWEDTKDELCLECKCDFNYYANYSDRCSECYQIWLKSPSILDFLCDGCVTNFNRIKRTLANLMIDFSVNPHLNMSFPYYTQIVFQYKTPHNGGYKLIGTGGRYDNLVKTITGKPLPAIGFSANIEILLSTLENEMLLTQPLDIFQIYILATDPELETSLLQIVQELRDNEIKVIIGRTEHTYDNQIKTAKKEGCSLMIIVNDEAIREGKVLIDNLIKKHRETINLRDILTTILRLKKILSNENY